MKANRSKTYLLPLLFQEIQFNVAFFSSITNAYIRTNKIGYRNCIFIEISKEISDNFGFLEHLQDNDLFREIITDEDRLIYVFNFPKKFIREYNLFKLSRYSEFGGDAKAYITKF